MTHRQRLFIGIYPAGVVYSDRNVVRNGDYKRLAFLSYATLRLTIEPDCSPAFAKLIREDAVYYRKGEEMLVSTCGHRVILGTEA